MFFGMNVVWLCVFVGIWVEWDWWVCEEWLVQFLQFFVDVDGIDIYFVYLCLWWVDVLVLLIMYGWLYMFVLQFDVVVFFIDFYVVVVSLFGFVFFVLYVDGLVDE